MVTHDDVESFLSRSEMAHEEVEEGLWVSPLDDGAKLVINHTAPVLLFRLKILDVPRDETRCMALYRRLLELNATDLVHAAYGVEGGDVILTETLELENLDYSEFQATVDSFQLAIAAHREVLAPFRDC
ncbi:MAG: YbjN domain-containing protein [Gemmatimonadota bacterium]|nr:YbjN domain-containing protein [Gemmatimonadota bacterium]